MSRGVKSVIDSSSVTSTCFVVRPARRTLSDAAITSMAMPRR
ncbi:Uncharacterised protein [Mycobacteroides abscessus]|nr:Uncharacterised protein [Mycobacteroides abscessus]